MYNYNLYYRNDDGTLGKCNASNYLSHVDAIDDLKSTFTKPPTVMAVIK